MCAATGGQALRFIIGLAFVVRNQDAGVLLPALAHPSPALDPVGEDTEHLVALSDAERTGRKGDHGSGAIPLSTSACAFWMYSHLAEQLWLGSLNEVQISEFWL